jgi:acyl carrier protein
MDPRIAGEVSTRFGEIMGISTEGLDFDARMDDVYGVTSVNLMRLISDLEIALDIEIPEAEGKKACSLAEVVRLCEQYAQPSLRVADGRG